MIKYILNFPLNQKIKQFGSFFILIFLLTATVIIVNSYGNFKSEQLKVAILGRFFWFFSISNLLIQNPLIEYVIKNKSYY